MLSLFRLSSISEDAWRLYFPETTEERMSMFRSIINSDSSWVADVSLEVSKTGKSFDKAMNDEIEKAVHYDTTQKMNSGSVKDRTNIQRYWPVK